MRYFVKLLKIVYSVFSMLVFIGLMLLLMPAVIIASFFGKLNGGNFIYRVCRIWSDIWFFCTGVFPKIIYEAEHDRTKQYIFVSNHISYFDIPMIFKVIRRQNICILGKFELSKVPIFGFIYRNAVVMVNRESTASRAKSVLQLKSVIKKGISVFIYPEGTFNITNQPLKDFYDGAFRIAIETETPIKPMLFLDTYDRMNYKSIFSITPGKCRAVFLPEVSVEGRDIDQLPILKQKVFDSMETALIKYKASWIKQTGLVGK